MALEVHIARPVLATIVQRAVQQNLRTACFPALGTHRVDHLDVAPAAVEFASIGGGVELRVPVDAFIASRADVLAAPNAAPPTTRGRGALVLNMTAAGTVTSLRVVDADTGPVPLPGGDQLEAAIVAGAGSPLVLDLKDALKLLGTATPARSVVELTAQTVAIRFDPAGPVQSRLQPGQEWGAFLDAAAMRAFARAGVPDLREMDLRITSFATSEFWRPEGTRPRVDIEFRGKADVPDPFSGDFDGAFRSRLSLAPTIAPLLRVDVDWELHVNLGPGVPGFVDNLVETFAIAMIDPAKFEAVRTGVRSFQRDLQLPVIEFGPRVAGLATRFEWRSALATPDGTTLGGPVRPLSDPGTATVQLVVNPFGPAHGIVMASQHGCIPGWQGEPPDDLVVTASAGLAGGGSVCGRELLSPNTGLDQYVELSGDAPDGQSVNLRLPVGAVSAVTEPVRMIVFTSRGVRLVDFGAPDAGGEAQVAYIDDCLYTDTYVTALLAYEEWWTLWGSLPQEMWHLFGGPPPLPEPPNPLYDPDRAGKIPGLYVKVVTVDGWEAGELVQVRTGAGTVDVTTDQLGRATIPIIVTETDRAPTISMTRVTRGDTSTAVARTAIFTRYAALPGGTRGNTITADTTGRATMVAEFDDGSDVYELVRGSAPRQVATRSAEHYVPTRTRSPLTIDLPGLVEIVPVPGFAKAPVAIAVLDDGTQLVLNRASDRSVRVPGPSPASCRASRWPRTGR
ncbi:MAG TPA: hypothetical protein VGP26_30040 [Actinophytocola sp.]|nr:hypothetical protein [Actinophytocola sp.]